MAEFNIVVLPAKGLADGRHKVRISVSHRGDTRYITTKYTVDSPSEVQRGKVVSRGDAGEMNIKLRQKLNELTEALEALDDPDIFTCAQLVQVLKAKHGHRHKTFEEVHAEYMEKLQAEKKFSTIKLYRLAKDRFEEYFKTQVILLEVIQPMDVIKFAAYLKEKRGLADASIKLYMSLVKVILDFAERMRYVRYEVNPFEFYSMPSYRPREIDLSIKEFQRLRDVSLNDYNLAIMRDIWLLSFYLGGINLVDMLKYNYKDKKVMKYKRTKTNSTKKENDYTVFDIQPEAQAIIDRYIQKNGKLAFGRYKTRTVIFQLFVRKKDELAGLSDLSRDFMYMSARKTFFQVGFDNGESTDVLDYLVGHATSRRMAMNYVKIRPEVANACMRRIFDLVAGKSKKRAGEKSGPPSVKD